MDVALAVASSAIIVGFNVRPDAAAKRAADKNRIRSGSTTSSISCRKI